MNDKIKEFIEENIALIEADNWEEIYRKAVNDLDDDIGKFTEFILQADIHPENYLAELPNWFLYKSDIKEFTIPNNITSIKTSAFHGCHNLTNVVIPDSVKSIGELAFAYCSSLTSVVIEDSITSINRSTFENCTSLSSITIPDSVTSIGFRAFFYCTSLTNIVLPGNVTEIDDVAFYFCDSLTNITIPNSVTRIGVNVFSPTEGLNINYSGTKDQWKNLSKGKFSGTTYTCTCIDGIIKKSR